MSKSPTPAVEVDPEVAARFWERVPERPKEGCWLWAGARANNGYGLVILKRQKFLATRISLALSGRPQPDGLFFALHSCDNPPCVNPEHLRWGSRKENARDAVERGLHHAASKTHCINGHPLSGENLRIRFDGYRACLTCLREAKRISARKARARDRAHG